MRRLHICVNLTCLHTHIHTHTHTFNGPLSGTTQVSRYQKGKTNLDFTEARDSEWQWHQLGHMQVCTSLQTDDHASTPPLSFLQAGCPSCRPTNSVRALKALKWHAYIDRKSGFMNFKINLNKRILLNLKKCLLNFILKFSTLICSKRTAKTVNCCDYSYFVLFS